MSIRLAPMLIKVTGPVHWPAIKRPVEVPDVFEYVVEITSPGGGAWRITVPYGQALADAQVIASCIHGLREALDRIGNHVSQLFPWPPDDSDTYRHYEYS